MKPAIKVENLGKQYRLGARQTSNPTLKDSLAEAVRGARNWRERKERTAGATLWALKDVNFEIMPGEVVGVIGSNGSGKSTLLKILSGITEPTEGEVRLRGRVGSLLEVGTGFHPDLTGRENIYLNGAILGMTRQEINRKFDEIVDFAEIEKFIDTPVKHYSSGMYMRLAFAVAAQLESDILLVDEVLAVGDAAFQRKCLGRMSDVAKEGRTVLFVSHNMAAVSALCKKAISLKQGNLLRYGSVQESIALYDTQPSSDLVEWRGDIGDEDVRLVHTWAHSLDPECIFHTAADIEVGIEVDILREVDLFIFGFWLLSSYDYELAYVRYDDNDNTEPRVIPPGRMVKRFIIPANTLGAGAYKIQVDVGIHMQKRIAGGTDGSLVFSVENTSGLGRRFITPRGRGFQSLLRPNWEVR